MKPWRQWIGVGLALGIIGALAPHFLQSSAASLEVREVRAQPTPLAQPAGSAQPGVPEQPELPVQRLLPPPLGMQATLGQLAEQPNPSPVEVAPAPGEPDLHGLDLLRLEIAPEHVTSPLPGGRVAELTLDPDLERATLGVFRRYGVPEAGTVLMDVRTGNLLVYASQVTNRAPFDVNLRAEAPSASVFKLITTAALLETGAVNADTEQCYHGGQSRIRAEELRENPARDQACSTLANALGHSLNVVFARLAQRHLTPERLSRMARAFGFGAPTPFDVPTEAPELDIPSEPLEFARAAAGFWHTSLSPLAAVSVAATIANRGISFRPRVVRAVYGEGAEWHARREPIELRRVMPEANARELGEMMLQTVLNGSASKAFHERGRAYLGDVRVAGKTGTLARQEQNRFYTWFVGFAPQDKPEVAVAALVVNTPMWRIKAAQLARDVLRAYFAKHGQPGVSPP